MAKKRLRGTMSIEQSSLVSTQSRQGEDAGAPVLEDPGGKMPFPFTGTLKKFVLVLEPEKLTEEEIKRLLAEEAKNSATIQ
jgi:arylsulfatase